MLLRRAFASLILAEHNNSRLSPLVASAVNAAEYFNDDIDVLVAGNNCESVATQVSKIGGVSSVLYANHLDLQYQQADSVAKVLHSVQLQKVYKRIIAASSNFSKDIIPRLGGILEVQPITEIIKIMNADCYKRAAYAGNAVYTVSSFQDLRLLLIRATSFEKNPEIAIGAPIEKIEVKNVKSLMKWVGEEIETKYRPDLSTSKIVVSGGKGLKNKEGFELTENLADVLGGAVGASRAAVDGHFCNNELQVGQTGKIIAPDLYIALGISGAIQHLAGMKDSKCIVSINTDPEAPIFEVSDYGLVADAFKTVPEIISKLTK